MIMGCHRHMPEKGWARKSGALAALEHAAGPENERRSRGPTR
jgi:hypothetical protein